LHESFLSTTSDYLRRLIRAQEDKKRPKVKDVIETAFQKQIAAFIPLAISIAKSDLPLEGLKKPSEKIASLPLDTATMQRERNAAALSIRLLQQGKLVKNVTSSILTELKKHEEPSVSALQNAVQDFKKEESLETLVNIETLSRVLLTPPSSLEFLKEGAIIKELRGHLKALETVGTDILTMIEKKRKDHEALQNTIAELNTLLQTQKTNVLSEQDSTKANAFADDISQLAPSLGAIITRMKGAKDRVTWFNTSHELNRTLTEHIKVYENILVMWNKVLG